MFLFVFTSAIGFHLLYYFSFWTYVLYVVYFVVVELELAGGASAWLARHNCIWSVVLCPRAAGPRVLSQSAPSGRLAACRQGFPRCTRDTSTQTLKILGSWMYALAYVNCDSFSFPFLVGPASPGARLGPAARSRLYLPMFSHTFARELQVRDRCTRYVVCATPRYVQYTYYETGEDIDRSTLTSPITYHYHQILLTFAREANVRCTDSSFKQLSI